MRRNFTHKLSLTRVFYCIAIGLALTAIRANADETQRTQTMLFRFVPTLVNDNEQMVQTVVGIPEGTRFELLPHIGLFTLTTPGSQLKVTNNQLTLTVEFKPTSVGQFQEDILLRKLPLPSTDTLRLRCTGTGYQIRRSELREFGDVVIGDQDTVYVLARVGLTSNEKWNVVPNPLPAPFSMDPPGTPIRRGDTLAFRFLFTPQLPKAFETTLRIQRMNNNNVVEAIEVTLRGNGVRMPIQDTVRFGTLLTADTVMRTKIFRKPGIKPDYEVAYMPKAPFKLHLSTNNRPTPVPPDSASVSASFAPTKPGSFTDSVVIHRRGFLGGDVVDTVTIVFTGSAVEQKKTEQLTFDNMSIGDTSTQSLSVVLPMSPEKVTFTYNLVQGDVGAVQGKLDPIAGLEIPITFVCTPLTYVPTQQQRFVLQRLRDDRVVDSTIIVVTTNMVRKVVRATILADTVQGNIGDTINITLRCMVTAGTADRIDVNTMVVRLGYNPTIWVPVETSNVRAVIVDDTAYCEVVLSNIAVGSNTQNSIIGTVKGVIAMGDASQCQLPLYIVSTESSGNEITTSSKPGLLVVKNVWQYANGGYRFVNPIQGLLTLDVSPNPISVQSTLTATNVPTTKGRLIIVDALGQMQADLTVSLRSGKHSWVVAKASGADVTLPTGTYYARLLVSGIGGDDIYSVTRLLVVE